MKQVTALVADDEPLLRERLAALLQRLWPELEIVATARNGREAVELFDQHAPQIVFLDVHMPGMNGVEAAQCIGQRAQIVFVTAHEQYAVEAFRQGAIDYIVKPLDEERLQETVRRLRQRWEMQSPPAGTATLGAEALEQLSSHLRAQIAPVRYLQWIKASVGSTVRLIPVEQIRYVKSDTKYTLVVWEGGEALIRKTIRELADELDPAQFLQIHRSAIVNLHQVQQFSHGSHDGGEVQIKGTAECLPVSRSFVHLFRQM
ncbi:MAG: LytTR family DNA-binding domain-containing protein [Pseudomonadota bacterium]